MIPSRRFNLQSLITCKARTDHIVVHSRSMVVVLPNSPPTTVITDAGIAVCVAGKDNDHISSRTTYSSTEELGHIIRYIEESVIKLNLTKQVRKLLDLASHHDFTRHEIEILGPVISQIANQFMRSKKAPNKEILRRKAIDKVVRVVGRILSQKNVWDQLRDPTLRIQLLEKFTSSVEQICLQLEENETVTISNSEMDLQRRRATVDEGSVEFESGDDVRAQLTFEVNRDKGSHSSNSVDVIFIRYKWLRDYYSIQDPSFPNGKPNYRSLVLSDVTTASVSKSHNIKVKKIRLRLSHMTNTQDVSQKGGRIRCGFFSASRFSWLYDGCRIIEDDGQKNGTVCECDHLTNFAVIMDFTGMTKKYSPTHKFILKIITLTGCVLSICSCLYAGFAYELIRRTVAAQSNRENVMTYIIYEMIFFSISTAQLIYVIGIDQTKYRVVCGIIAAFLQFFFLLQFEWMTMSGVFYFLVFAYPFKLAVMEGRRRYIIGTLFLIPLVIVTISAALRHEGYGTDEICWLSTENGLLWAFLGPLTLCLVINMTLLALLIYHTTKNATPSIEGFASVETNKKWIFSRKTQYRYELLYSVTLGATWIIGYFHISHGSSLVVSFVFSILNSLQGVFICLLYGNWRRMLKAYAKFLSRRSWVPQHFRNWFHQYDLRKPMKSATLDGTSDSNALRLTRVSYSPRNGQEFAHLRIATSDRSSDHVSSTYVDQSSNM